jgi:hypothetical protein
MYSLKQSYSPREGVMPRARSCRHGRVFSSPSLAAIKAADIPAYDGWYAWRVPRLPEEPTRNDLRLELADRRAADTGQ